MESGQETSRIISSTAKYTGLNPGIVGKSGMMPGVSFSFDTRICAANRAIKKSGKIAKTTESVVFKMLGCQKVLLPKPRSILLNTVEAMDMF